MIGDDGWPKKPRKFDPSMAVGHAHHCNFHLLIAQAGDASGPLPFDQTLSFELQAELLKEFNHRAKVLDDDSYVVHAFERHAS